MFASKGKRSYLAKLLVVAILGAALASPPVLANSQTGSKTVSSALLGESALVVSGSTEILYSSAELVVTNVVNTAHGVRLVLRPVAQATSTAAEVVATVAVEISHAAWQAAVKATKATGRAVEGSLVAVGDLIETVALHATVGTSIVVVGAALVAGGFVLAIVAEQDLEALLGHGEHRCRIHP